MANKRTLMKKIQAYARQTETPVSECVSEALEVWWECMAEPRLEAFRRASNVVEFRRPESGAGSALVSLGEKHRQ